MLPTNERMMGTNTLREWLHLGFLQDYRLGKVQPTEYSDVFVDHLPLESIAESVELFLQWVDTKEG